MDVEEVIKEAGNRDRIPFKDMSANARGVLCVRWRDVERFCTDRIRWVKNDVCPRSWNAEAYRVMGVA